MKQTVLDVIEFGAQMVLSEHFATKANIESARDLSGHWVEVNLVQKVLGQKLESIRHDWPTDWREALKERWLPAWAKKRWPVRMAYVELKADVLYPRIAIPQDEHHLYLHKVTGIDWRTLPMRDVDA